MEELLRTSFTVGQQWVHDMYNDKEVVSFNEWYNSDEVQQQLKILNIPVVVGRSEQFICSKCSSDWGEIRKICFNCEHEEDVSK